MTTIRSTHDDDHPHFAIVRPTAQNKALSYEALGMLAYVLSQADDWVIGVDDLIREGCGRDKAYRILKELSEAGHLTRVRSAAGQHKPPVWGGYVAHEQPFTEMADLATTLVPIPEMPDLVKPSIGAPNPEKAEPVKSVEIPARGQQPDLESLNALKLKDQELKDKDKKPDADPRVREDEILPEPPSIYAFYVENMRQQVNGILKDKLVDWVKDVGEQWVRDAITEAVTHNVPTWAYAEACLENWAKFGRDTPRPSSVKGAGLKPAPHATVQVAIASTSRGAPRIRRENP